uniref:Uncharacterized protein n=1 Tax=Chromera velia CCMP2878 TaxID=1169474 RepID=A0A0G4H0M9_9ALVE|eukprot:Cvel_24133.t1-p1 / transcript=Cvel_24133.t1 / gene=Cvel_24133 / organism=Chromera_velia_CCMP2878 / gene_product=hypothetical protein / transcript_product=hypothetical protein / location=Cvel_scaffold2574:1794-5757(+) / protein_length=712 / sequence_SO=supercontig / SO=protein_coding / is_pseudo=false
MRGAASDPGRYRRPGSVSSYGGSCDSADSASEWQSVQTAPAANLDAERTAILDRMRGSVVQGSNFQVVMSRLCRTAFHKDFGVLPPDLRSCVSVATDASDSSVDRDILQSDMLVLSPHVFDPVGDREFAPEEQRKMVRGGEPYFLPAGWTRAGMKMPDLSGCSQWYVAFDGKRFDNRNSLVKNGVLLPARVRSGGLVVLHLHQRVPTGDRSLSGTSNSSFGMRGAKEEKGWSVSQSIHYAALFAQPFGLEKTYLQLVYQVLVNPSQASHSAGEFMHGMWDSSLPFDPNFSNKRLQCAVSTSGVIVTGLLFREVRSHPYELTVQRIETVRRWKKMRSESAVYMWLFKWKAEGAASEEWMQFGTAIQDLLNSQWREGRAISSPFRMRIGNIGPPEGYVWEVVFCLPIVRIVDDPSVCFTVGTSAVVSPAPPPAALQTQQHVPVQAGHGGQQPHTQMQRQQLSEASQAPSPATASTYSPSPPVYQQTRQPPLNLNAAAAAASSSASAPQHRTPNYPSEGLHTQTTQTQMARPTFQHPTPHVYAPPEPAAVAAASSRLVSGSSDYSGSSASASHPPETLGGPGSAQGSTQSSSMGPPTALYSHQSSSPSSNFHYSLAAPPPSSVNTPNAVAGATGQTGPGPAQHPHPGAASGTPADPQGAQPRQQQQPAAVTGGDAPPPAAAAARPGAPLVPSPHGAPPQKGEASPPDPGPPPGFG